MTWGRRRTDIRGECVIMGAVEWSGVEERRGEERREEERREE